LTVKQNRVAMLMAVLALSLGATAHADEQQPPPGRRFPQGQARQLPLIPAQAGEPVQGREASWPQPGGPGRLSPEERRQLRRDINEHGRDIYGEGERRAPR
jgi:hypothetical protein